jgi:REP element-mobilizing transposase RayT
MKTAKQTGFKILEDNNVTLFGGAHLNKGNPKKKRPLSIKNTTHLVMRSLLATGPRSFMKFEKRIEQIIRHQAKVHGVRIYRLANGGNHLHMLILPRSRVAFNKFIRAISGLIARLVLKAERGSAKNLQFWEKRPFTRIVQWGQDFKGVCSYLLQNSLEAAGFIPYQARKTRYPPKTSTA